ncbi:MAG: CRTAC1 family protein [Planctomycetota bacterium]
MPTVNTARNHCACAGLLVSLLISIGCQQQPAAPPSPAPAESPAHAAPDVLPSSFPTFSGLRFSEQAAMRRLDFQYQNGAQGQALMVESIGGGAGWLDLDHDERPDVLFVQGGSPLCPDSQRPLDVLLRQTPGGPFVSIAETAGLDDRQYSQGTAIADYDNDGFDDLLITNYGQNVLYHNSGDGTFRRVPQAFEDMPDRWSSSAAWADLDRDGCLDLYICNYLQYDVLNPAPCFQNGRPSLCHPRQLEPWPDECWRNSGDGRFERVTGKWGLKGPGNKALGVAILDLTDDARPDIYVANDTTANFLFVRREPDGQFVDEALRRGAAVSGTGDPQASMGVAVGDYDGNGLPDVLLSHFSGESNTLYQNTGAAGMLDVSAITGMRELSFPKLGFGIVLQDFNQDTHMDCLIANGHIDERTDEFDGYQQRPQLLSFDGSRWRDCSDASDWFSNRFVGRGIALGDLDADGDLDAVVVHQNAPAALLVNESVRKNWLQIRFTGTLSNRQGIGCHVTIRKSDHTTERMFSAELPGGTSFASSHQPLLNFGLGNFAEPVDVEVRWPSGAVQTLRSVSPQQILRLREPISW